MNTQFTRVTKPFWSPKKCLSAVSSAAAFLLLMSPVLAEQDSTKSDTSQQPKDVVMQLDQTVISGNQELPKVLYILPWQEPDGLPMVDVESEFSEADVFRRLYPPAYRRELSYYESLSGESTNNSDQE